MISFYKIIGLYFKFIQVYLIAGQICFFKDHIDEKAFVVVYFYLSLNLLDNMFLF